MILPPGLSMFQAVLPFKMEWHTCMGYATTEILVCYGCGELGHVKKLCPKDCKIKLLTKDPHSTNYLSQLMLPIQNLQMKHLLL